MCDLFAIAIINWYCITVSIVVTLISMNLSRIIVILLTLMINLVTSDDKETNDFTFEDFDRSSDNLISNENIVGKEEFKMEGIGNLLNGFEGKKKYDPDGSAEKTTYFYPDQVGSADGSGFLEFNLEGSAEGSGLLEYDMEGSAEIDLDLDTEMIPFGSGVFESDDKECGSISSSIYCDGGNTCVSKGLICDGVVHCKDYFDELYCDHKRECRPGELRCLDGTCVHVSEKCNGFYTCPDESDESYCEGFICPRGSFKCADGICIPERLRCDRHSYCRDGSDEWNCTYEACLSTEYQCSDGTCLLMEKRCNGYYDCLDYSEEKACEDYSCLPGYFQCDDGICIPENLRCDGHNYCRDSSDEWDCYSSPSFRLPDRSPLSGYVYLFAVPLFQVVMEGQEVVFRCRDETHNRAAVIWIREDGEPIDSSRSTDILGRLTIRYAKLDDAGVYLCKATGQYIYTTGLERAVTLYVQSDSYPRQTLALCPNDYFTCSDGDCVLQNAVCNGYADCTDKSDEDRCKIQCEPDEFRCKNRKCISFSWVCDSQDDCGDSSDEDGCHVLNTDVVCYRDEFSCTNNQQCVPKYLQCDNTADCLDGSDEFGCSKPIVLESPSCYKATSIGGKFTLSCNATAEPTPVIVWRLNWGYLPSTCSFQSEDGFGLLTCNDVGKAHQGAYSCEAINYLGISFGNDAYVIIETEYGSTNTLRELCS